MTLHVYRSDDADAPSLSNLQDSLIQILDACLVNGYGAKAGAGWAKVFSGTNKAVYRAPAGKRFYLRVWENDTNSYYAYVRGYLSMSDVDTGVEPFPTELRRPSGIISRKTTNTSPGKPWGIFATDKSFYYINFAGTNGAAFSATSVVMCTHFFGDLVPSDLLDDYCSGLCGGLTSESTSSAANINLDFRGGDTLNYLPRNFAGDIGAVECHLFSQQPGSNAAPGAWGPTYPDNEFGGLALARIPLAEPNMRVRGFLPGVYNPLHNFSGNHLDTIVGTGALAGKDLQVFYQYSNSAAGALVMDMSGEWY